MPIQPSKWWTAAMRARAIRNLHPATGLPFNTGGETCRGCIHRVSHSTGKRRYHKCELVPITFGPGTDIRLWWPACTKWESSERPSAS